MCLPVLCAQLAHHEEKLMLMEQSLQTTQDQLSQRVTEVVRHEQHSRKLQVNHQPPALVLFSVCFKMMGGSMVKRSPNSNPKTLGSIPWWGQGKVLILCPSESTLVRTCLFLTPPTPSVCTACTQICARVKDATSICCKRGGLTAGAMETSKHCTQEKNQKIKLGSPGKAAQICCALHWDRKDK